MSDERDRGASYMDNYDSNNTYDYGDDTHLGSDRNCVTKCAKHCLFGVNFGMLLVGVALVAVAVFSQQNNGNDGFQSFSDEIIYLAIASGVLVIVVSFLGCVGATTESRVILIIYFIVLVLSIIMECVVIGLVFSQQSTLKNYLEDQWDNSLSESKKTGIEAKYECCGFDTGDSCASVQTNSSATDGCYDALYDEMTNQLFVLGFVTIGVGIYEIIMAVFALFFCIKLKNQ